MGAFIGLFGGVCVVLLALFFALVPLDSEKEESRETFTKPVHTYVIIDSEGNKSYIKSSKTFEEISNELQ